MMERPVTSIAPMGGSGETTASCILMRSAVRSPMCRLWRRRMYLMMASSTLSPARGTLSLTTALLMEMTAMSVVPPPMSTTMQPPALVTGSPAPMAAATGSSMSLVSMEPASAEASTTLRRSTSVTPEGTQTTTRGRERLKRPSTCRR